MTSVPGAGVSRACLPSASGRPEGEVQGSGAKLCPSGEWRLLEGSKAGREASALAGAAGRKGGCTWAGAAGEVGVPVLTDLGGLPHPCDGGSGAQGRHLPPPTRSAHRRQE